MKDSKPTVWIISYFANGPTYFPRVPDYNIAEYLQRNGYNMLIFAGSSVHNTNKNFIEDDALYKEQIVDDVPFVFVKSRTYESRKGETLSFIDFYRNLMKIYNKFTKPDVIIAQMPQPLSCLAGIRIAKKYKVPYITYIVDLWPLSIVEYANFSDHNPIIQMMYKYEKWVYKKSDELVFTWEGAYDYIIDKHWERQIPRKKFHYINIGVNLKRFYSDQEQNKVTDKDLEDPSFKVMYCGSIRTANDIGTVVDCAKILCEEGYSEKVHFYIYGDGPDREVLEEKCRQEGISNVFFKGYIDKKYVPFVLSKSNLNILNLKPAGTQKYGNSSNKLFEYFAAGNPVIANIDEGKYPIISKYQCGIVVPSGNPLKYAEGIKRFYHMSEVDRKQYSENAVKTVHLFDTEVLNAEWKEIISNLIKNKA